MTDPSASKARSPVGRLAILTLVVLIGLGLFFLLARRTPVVVRPVESESPS
jgi:hypothetical protein